MKFKTFLKKVNRGLVLGSVVLVGFVIYVAVDTISFTNQKPELEDKVDAYFKDLSALCVTPEKYRDIDKPSDEYEDELNAQVKELTDKYWTTSNTNMNFFYGVNKSTLATNVLTMTENTDGYVSDWFYKVSDINVKKSGPDIVTISYSTDITATYYGDANVLYGAQTSWCSYSNYYGMPNGDYSEDDEFQAAFSLDETMTLNKKDGEWKIAYISNNGYTSDITSAEDMEVTE